jgi:hypothetical protein
VAAITRSCTVALAMIILRGRAPRTTYPCLKGAIVSSITDAPAGSPHVVGMKRTLFAAALLLAACSREVPVQQQSVMAPPPPTPRPPVVSYYEGAHAAEAIQQIRAKVGEPFRVMRISVDNDSVTAEVQDPKKKENVDSYEIQRGEMRAPRPVHLVGETDQKTIDANMFDPAGVDWTKITEILRQGNEKIQLEGRELSDISIERDMYADGRPIIVDVNYRGTRKNGFLRLDRHGAHPEVNVD